MRMGIGLGVGINRSNYAQGIFSAYQSRVTADGGVTEAGACVDAVSSLLQSASLLLIPSGYKSGKAYAEIPTNGNGDLTWTRASTALRTNSSGLLESMGSGVPRLSYMYGSCPALLLEPQRTNLLTYSEQFSDASWLKSQATITANSTTAPDGTTTADSIIENNLSGLHYISKAAGTAGTYALSLYVKADTRNWVYLTLFDGVVNRGAYFNVSSGTVGDIDTGATASIQSVGNGWYRCIVTATSTFAFTASLTIATANNTISYTGNGTSGLYLWGAQIEAGAYPTTYIPTTSGATATRVADSASKTGISSLIGQSEGVLFAEVQGFSNDTARFAISDGTNNNNIYIELSASNISAVGRVGAVNQFSIISSQTLTNVNKIAIKYKTNDFALYVNGVQVGTDTSGSTYSPNTLNTFRFDRGDGFIPFYGNVKQIILFPNALTNAELATLTT